MTKVKAEYFQPQEPPKVNISKNTKDSKLNFFDQIIETYFVTKFI